MAYPVVRLKKGRDVSVRAGHPWIFSNAIEISENTACGAIVEVRTHENYFVGYGFWNPHTSIRVRMISRLQNEVIGKELFEERFRVLSERKKRYLPPETNAYRLVHGDADTLPGLIIDWYNDTAVFQIHTAGMDAFRHDIIDALLAVFHPRGIVERSDVDNRIQEGLSDLPIAVRYGTIDKPVVFSENGITYIADVLEGQKTGFFLDQRDVRMTLMRYTAQKRVLNLFSYSGAFSICASRGGATAVVSVDSSRRALDRAQEIATMNHLAMDTMSFVAEDVFTYIHKHCTHGMFDLIICDPPAFAKSQQKIESALKAYTTLNSLCFSQLEVGGILVSSSCSGRVSAADFKSMLKIAAGRAGRDVRILSWLGQPYDHTEKLSFPEGSYLKTAIVEVCAVDPAYEN